ncbi:MAG: hypothetical protein RBG13Loki_1471 [Promethearchaeota archaeon CR_4]|nr:MAG: hypothetical protein RBG13Loki_1471 [Candidatus Lokiarchaeota archaeon CR_4]
MPITRKGNGKSSGKRNGSTLFTMWLPDRYRERWEAARKLENKKYSSLAKFVIDVVNSYIDKEEVRVEQKMKFEAIVPELKEFEKLMETKWADIQNQIITSKEPKTAPPEIKSRIVDFLNILKRPATWEEIVRIVPFTKEETLNALEDLFKSKILTMTKEGEWKINE